MANTKNSGVWDFGVQASLAGDALKLGENFTFNDDFWLGKNGKFYSPEWGGNGRTGGKFKFAKNLGKLFGKASNVLGAYSLYSTYQDDTITKDQKIVDQTVNGIGFLGTYGAAFNFGFNLGYVIEDACDCNIQLNPRYFNAKYIKRHGWRFDKFFEDPKRPYRSVFDR